LFNTPYVEASLKETKMTIETTAADADLVPAHPAFDYAAWEEERAQEIAASRVELATAKSELCAALEAAGVVIVVAGYYGDGDSGNTQEAISYSGNAATPLSGELSSRLGSTADGVIEGVFVAECGDGDSGTQIVAYSDDDNAATPLSGELQPPLDNTVIPLSGELQSRLDDFVDRVVSTNASGYENHDGGGGTVTINVASQEIIMEHYDNVVEQVHQTFSL